MKIAGCVVLLVAAGLVAGCKDNPVADDIPTGAFRYIGYDTLGQAVVQGYLRMALTDSNRIEGDWALVAIAGESTVGPQTGSGSLEGEIVGTTIRLNLNPQMIDNNVLLSGELRGNIYAGEWMFVGFPGVLNRGTFAARR